MKNETITDNTSKGQQFWVQCERCQNETRHFCRASVEVRRTSPEDDAQVDLQFQIIECQGCGWISFRQSWTSSEDTRLGGEGFEQPVEHVELFPRRSGTKPLEHDYYLPDRVLAIYREVVSALLNEQPILAGIGIRALVEAVCEEKGATEYNLSKRIDQLVTLGELTKDGAEILHGIRLLGNKAAHEVAAPTVEQLKSGMQVAENLLVNVYILKKVAEKLPKKT
jgi:ribosomal protein S27E